MSIPIAPSEAQPPLVVDANTVLAFTVAPQRLQTVSGRRRQIMQFYSAIQLPKLSPGNVLDGLKTSAAMPVVKAFRLPAPE